MLAPSHSAIDKGEHEKYVSFLAAIRKYGKFTHDSKHLRINYVVTVKR